MKRVKFVHPESGLERVIKVRNNAAMRELGLGYQSFQHSIPYELFPDVKETVPGMPILEVKVRCCRKHHRLLLWPDGRLTMAAHQGKKARQAMKVAQAMGQKYRCVEVLEAYRGVCEGRTYGIDKKVIPQPLLKIAERCYAMKSNRRWLQREDKTDIMVRLEAQREKLRAAASQRVTLHDEYQRYRCRFTNSHGVSQKHGVWFKKALLSGIIHSDLSKDGLRFYPTLIPDHIIRAGCGYIPARDQDFNEYWIFVERTAEQNIGSVKGKKPIWVVEEYQRGF